MILWYQHEAERFDHLAEGDTFGDYMSHLALMGLGLSGEAGESADIIKKAWRDDGEMTPERKLKLAYELGDTLWYIARIASRIGYTMDELCAMNIRKLSDRQARGVIGGEGDDR